MPISCHLPEDCKALLVMGLNKVLGPIENTGPFTFPLYVANNGFVG